MKISLLWTELFNFPKRGADLAENRLESTLCARKDVVRGSARPRAWRNGDSAMEQEALFTMLGKTRTEDDHVPGVGGEQHGLGQISCPDFFKFNSLKQS